MAVDVRPTWEAGHRKRDTLVLAAVQYPAPRRQLLHAVVVPFTSFTYSIDGSSSFNILPTLIISIHGSSCVVWSVHHFVAREHLPIPVLLHLPLGATSGIKFTTVNSTTV